MKVFATLLSILFSIISIYNVSAQSSDNKRSGEIMVQLYDQKDIDRLLNDYNAFSLQQKTTVSERFNIYLLQFDEDRTSDKALIEAISLERTVANVQNNHRLDLRELNDTTPDDQLFYTQWALNNTGQNGGYPEADIDALKAWDFGTGGVTALGDTIVIAILDGGSDLNHEDMDFWKNRAEIPDNGIDDDTNGYIDDYDGWNAYLHNGHIPANAHGVHVGGIAGAIGNNGIGIAGVNWHVKTLPVAGESTNEATVVEAMSFIYVTRETYDETDGAKGAFIVAQNNSFGVDQGQPEDYPIWEAMYDSLGELGILSMGATANVHWDIDSVGDIPTAFTTDYMISVTNTTNKDKLSGYAGYGDTTIDLGAPGTIVGSCIMGNQYGTKTGTSQATPHVTGAVALMFSLADSAFMVAYKNNPGEYVLKFKEHILSSTDSLDDLVGKTVSGGRLNLFKAISSFLGAPVLAYSPASINVGVLKDDIEKDTLIISNVGSDTLNYTITVEDDPEWLTLSKTEGSLTGGQSDNIELVFNSAGLDTGYYYSTLYIEQEDGAVNAVPVQMHVYSDVGIDDNFQRNADVTVYPNPFSDVVKFEINSKYGDQLTIEIFDRSGKIVFEQSLNSNAKKTEFSWSDQQLRPGLYFYKVRIGNSGIATGKILKL